MNYLSVARHVCTYLNAFLVEIPNMFMRFKNSDIFYNFLDILDVSSALYAMLLSVKYFGPVRM